MKKISKCMDVVCILNTTSYGIQNVTAYAEELGEEYTLQREETIKSDSEFILLSNMTNIDTPRTTVSNQDIQVSGWALNLSGVKEVNVHLDGVKKGVVATGINRPDVDAAYPGYPGGSNSGYEFIIDKNSVAPGNHILKVDAIGNDGSITSESIEIELKKYQI